MRTHVIDNNKPFGQAGSLTTANAILPNQLFPKTDITLIHAVQHEAYAEVAYLESTELKNAKIPMEKLQDFAIDKWHDQDKPGDITVYDFVDENLIKVIEAYIAAGKEILPL